MANQCYNRGLFRLGDYKWDTDAISLGVLLMKSTYVFDATHNVVQDLIVAANEASGAGYSRKTIAAAARSVVESDPDSAAHFMITDGTVVWTGLNAGIGLAAVLFFIGGGGINDDANNDLLCFINVGTNIPINSGGGDVTLNFSSSFGALRVTSPPVT